MASPTPSQAAALAQYRAAPGYIVVKAHLTPGRALYVEYLYFSAMGLHHRGVLVGKRGATRLVRYFLLGYTRGKLAAAGKAILAGQDEISPPRFVGPVAQPPGFGLL